MMHLCKSFRILPIAALVALFNLGESHIINLRNGLHKRIVGPGIQSDAPRALFPPTGPAYQNIYQVTTPDCWLESAEAAVAYADPKRLQTIVVRGQDRNAVVTLYDTTGNGIPYTVPIKGNAQADNAPASQAQGAGKWAWPEVMQEAMNSYAEAHSGQPGINEPAPPNGQPAGGNPGAALAAFYGSTRKVSRYSPGTDSDDALWDVLNNAKTNPACACTNGDATKVYNGIVNGHAYTIIGGDRGSGTVTLRNPWGLVTQDKTTVRYQQSSPHFNHLSQRFLVISRCRVMAPY